MWKLFNGMVGHITCPPMVHHVDLIISQGLEGALGISYAILNSILTH